jgi:hypothetical protein
LLDDTDDEEMEGEDGGDDEDDEDDDDWVRISNPSYFSSMLITIGWLASLRQKSSF